MTKQRKADDPGTTGGRAKALAAFLKSKGIPVESWKEGDFSEDGIVEVGGDVHIQVTPDGQYIVGVVMDKGESVRFRPETPSRGQILDDLAAEGVKQDGE